MKQTLLANLYTRLILSSGMLCIGAASLKAQPSAETLPTFRKVVLETDVDNPMELEVLPDGRVLFVERFGKVRIWKPDTQRTVLAATLDVHGNLNPGSTQGPDHGSWESGLIGLTLAPEFEKTGWIYLYYSPAGDVPENRVSRFTLKGDTLDLGSEKIVLRVPVQREVCCHEAGSLAFDAEGNLFISTGDNTNPFASSGYNPTDYRDGRYPWDAARSAGNANDLRGKILRIHPDPDGSYTIPEGNLFPPGTPNTKPEIYVMGCRNPFRIAIDKETGTLSWGEVGPDARELDASRGPAGFDEINRTRTAGNFGWPFVIADNKPYRQYDFDTRSSGPAQDVNSPKNHSPQNTGPVQLPPARPAWIWYPYAPSIRFPLAASGGRTACAGPFYHYQAELESERKLPPLYDGVQFIYEWERGWILAVRTDEQGAPSLEPFAPDIKLKRPAEMELGPDGALYIIEFGTGWENNKDAQIVRIEHVPASPGKPLVNTPGAELSDEALLRFYNDCLEGGNADRGKSIFLEKIEASCSRCHQAGAITDGILEGDGVGPNLATIGSQRDRTYLLEALLLPNKAIAPGYENLLVTMNDGKAFAGLLKRETSEVVELTSPEDGPVTLRKSDIRSRELGLSPMPNHLRYVLSKAEFRDLIEFLANLRE